MINQLPISRPSINDDDVRYVTDAVASGWVSSLGPYITRFEEDFAKYCGVNYALTVSNGTTALHLALVAAGIGVGDEVIIPDLTFIATANAVTYTGATPVIVDVDPNTLCISTQEIIKNITDKTKAIIPVHLYGHPADMSAIVKVADQFGLIVIEDAAEAHGASCNGVKVGALGHCGVFSFYGNKIITTGEGGMITTNDIELYTFAKKLRDHGMSAEKRYWHDVVAYNYRMTNMQAALGCSQLNRIDSFISERRKILSWYVDCIDSTPGLVLNRGMEWADAVPWMICVEIDGYNRKRRDELINKLKQIGIETRPYFYPISMMPIYKGKLNLNAHHFSEIGLNLPMYIGITREDVSFISNNLIRLINECC